MKQYSHTSVFMIVSILLLAFMTGCATTRIGDDELTPEQRELRQQAKAYNKTVGQGVAWGALLGAVAGAAVGGSSNRGRNIAAGAAIGATAGGIAGSYYAERQREAASKEAFLANMIDDVREYNQESMALIATAEQVYVDGSRRLAQLKRQYQNGSLDRSILDRQIVIAKADHDLLTDSLKFTRNELEKYQESKQQYARDFPGQDISELENEIAQIELRVEELESLSDRLMSDIEAADVT